MDLVILAAGMGSRFGGLKQIEPIDKYGNFIIDYSIFDAKRAGFNRVIFIIKEENYHIFKETIGKRVEDKIETLYAFQKLDLLPEGYHIPSDRVKPLGTAQAILAAKDLVSDKFIIINADDYYGVDAFKVAADYLSSLPKGASSKYANVAYNVANTMTENGSVKRGVLVFDDKKNLQYLIESKIEKVDGKIHMRPLDNEDDDRVISKDTLVSMNMFCFTKDIMNYIEDNFVPFMEENKNNLDKCEYLIPTLVSSLIAKNEVSVRVLGTEAVWYGITYREDKEDVVNSLRKLMDEKVYPEGIWEK
ncbi:MAG: sugar phosphate nucleotidyltransferase [Bacillales bacterium]|nr:sugar phosphate nucleotidyltransferase [Bacillales bacterium]MDD6808052.1 sugar phosphate nucleotidyltransferase [Oscillospiraceae bacterium]